MQVPDFMTSAFKSLMTLRMGSLGTGSDSDGKLATTVAAPLHCEMPVSLAASKQWQHHFTARDVTKFKFERWQILNDFAAFDIRRM